MNDTHPLDLNKDGYISTRDVQILNALARFQAGTINQATLTTLLNNLGVNDRTAQTALMNLDVNAIIPDLNNDNNTDLQDVRILYYALRFGDILRPSPSLREVLLSGLTTEDDAPGADRQQVYIDMLNRVADLFPVVTTGDHAIEVDEGKSYALSPDDLSAHDPDHFGAALIWRVTTAPANGRLALSTAPGTAISPGMSFTQAQLEAGQVLYVHTGSDDMDDSFAVQVANPADREGTAPVPPVTLNVTISTPVDMAPTGVTLRNVVSPLAEDVDVSTRTRVADIAVTDADGGPRNLELVGPDAALFELGDDPDTGMPMLFLRADAALDFETNPTLEVTVRAVRNPAAATAAT